MNHSPLGNIQRDPKTGDGLTRIWYDSRDIQVRIIQDDQPFETTLKLAEEVIVKLKELDNTAKKVIVDQMREGYNDGWNEYDEVQEDGSLKSVSNPPLNEVEFREKFSLDAVNVTGSRVVDFFYQDSGLFWGHSVVVVSLAGTDFSGARAELFG